jgi:two-component system, NtrC family, sensor histidine kinase PilS
MSEFTPSLLGPILAREPLSAHPDDWAFARLWRGFMSARVVIACVLLVLLAAGLFNQFQQVYLAALVGLAYVCATALARWLLAPAAPGRAFDKQWPFTVGVDLLTYGVLQLLPSGGMSYTPLFAVPVLFASVMGSFTAAIATAAVATLVLLFDAWWYSVTAMGESASRFLQAGLTGVGFFVVAFLANQLSQRLVREERVARMSQLAARSQVQVNEVIIDSMSDGVLVVDASGLVRSVNPAARRLIAGDGQCPPPPFALDSQVAWHELSVLARDAYGLGEPVARELSIAHESQAPRSVHARAIVTRGWDAGGQQLCVLFVEDLRDMEARVRTEKLAAMGRMSAAIAHEIRNPLAAIAQANALLDEDLSEPSHKRLTEMVRSNALRLDKIVQDVLNLARVREVQIEVADPVPLDVAVRAVASDWAEQKQPGHRLLLELQTGNQQVRFDPEHLRRVLVNLLDNALRYASQSEASIKIKTRHSRFSTSLAVWSDGDAIEPAVRDRLFEPFYSSESRSSGLGLYICRELCERHGAALSYRRRGSKGVSGNEFLVSFPVVTNPHPMQESPVQAQLIPNP